MKSLRRMKLKKMLTESKEDGGATGAVLALFIAIILAVGFVVAAVKLGYNLDSIVTAFQRFFGMLITLGGR